MRIECGCIKAWNGRPPRLAAPSRLVFGEQPGRRSPAGLVLEVDLGERLAAAVSDGEARGLLLGGPRWREAASGHLIGYFRLKPQSS